MIAGSFAVSGMAAVGLAVVYALGGQPQLEGVLLGLALGGLAAGLGVWASRIMTGGEQVEERHELPSSDLERRELWHDFEQGERPLLTRRKTLLGLFGLAAGGLGLAALFPIRSLGVAPASHLRRTAWKAGSRVVTGDGELVRVDTLPVGGVLTVWPEGAGQPADSQTLLIRVESGALNPRRGREDWSPAGYVAYSKICTHAGCPVGLYNTQTHELLCPCHQSLFDVLDGARPIFGPATRSLPQLPLEVDAAGVLTSRSDYTTPVGPGFWDRGR
jgi:ubiquinol-cytochrome c reductase iron-sulfur subunit